MCFKGIAHPQNSQSRTGMGLKGIPHPKNPHSRTGCALKEFLTPKIHRAGLGWALKEFLSPTVHGAGTGGAGLGWQPKSKGMSNPSEMNNPGMDTQGPEKSHRTGEKKKFLSLWKQNILEVNLYLTTKNLSFPTLEALTRHY